MKVLQDRPIRKSRTSRASEPAAATATRPRSVDPATPPRGWRRFYRLVQRIPRGRISTYGRIAELAGMVHGARQVGYALAALGGTQHDVPWHRVLGSRPRNMAAISLRDPTGAALQRMRLEAEGVEFDLAERVSFERFGWEGPRPRRR